MSSSSSDAPIKSTPNSPNFNYKTCKRCGKVRHILHQENDDDNDAGENCEDWNPNKDCFSPSLIMHPTMNDIIKRAKNFCADNTIVILNDVPKTPYRSATTKSLEKHKFDKLKQSGVKKLLQSIARLHLIPFKYQNQYNHPKIIMAYQQRTNGTEVMDFFRMANKDFGFRTIPIENASELKNKLDGSTVGLEICQLVSS